MTPEERRHAFIRSQVPDTWSEMEKAPARSFAVQAWNSVLAHFDQHEAAVANAIRYGLVEIPDAGWRDQGDFDSHTEGIVVSGAHVHVDNAHGAEPIYRVNKS